MVHNSPALRRYRYRAWAMMLAYVLLLGAALWALKNLSLTRALAVVIAVCPAVPLTGMIWLVGRYIIEEEDDFHRSMWVEALLWAMGVLLVLATAWGLLEEWVHAPHVPLYWAFPVASVAMLVAIALIHRRYD